MNDLSEEELVEMLIEESGNAKHLLREAGFGVTGTNLLRTVQEALDKLYELGYEKP